MTDQQALNGIENDRPHYEVVLKKDAAWLVGSIVGGVVASILPLLLGGYGFNLQTTASVLIIALAGWIAWNSYEGVAYCIQMIRNRQKEKRRRVRRSIRVAQAT